MKHNPSQLPDNVHTHFAGLGYRQFQMEAPDFGGVLLYFRNEGSEPEAAYYISKPSAIELVTSDELRHALDFLEGSDIPLRYVVTTSPFSAGSHKLAGENRITLKELQPEIIEATRRNVDGMRLKDFLLRLAVIFANSSGRAKGF